ncbi:MAG TPA: hypothetical protein VGN64_06950 [Dyadobacter sp.]|jgi:glycogen operon protein|nr:hypothetical protein [Dyadobacter sp.]
MLTTLLLSQGVPMILAGDECSKSKKGNNNTYCQDNELSWQNWDKADKELLKFTKGLIHLRQSHPTFQRRRWFQDLPVNGSDIKDIIWFAPDGNLIPEDKWGETKAEAFGVFLNGLGIRCVDLSGQILTDDHFYIIFNPSGNQVDFTLPTEECGSGWKMVVSTSENFVGDQAETIAPGEQIQVQAHSMCVFHCALKESEQ